MAHKFQMQTFIIPPRWPGTTGGVHVNPSWLNGDTQLHLTRQVSSWSLFLDTMVMEEGIWFGSLTQVHRMICWMPNVLTAAEGFLVALWMHLSIEHWLCIAVFRVLSFLFCVDYQLINYLNLLKLAVMSYLYFADFWSLFTLFCLLKHSLVYFSTSVFTMLLLLYAKPSSHHMWNNVIKALKYCEHVSLTN